MHQRIRRIGITALITHWCEIHLISNFQLTNTIWMRASSPKLQVPVPLVPSLANLLSHFGIDKALVPCFFSRIDGECILLLTPQHLERNSSPAIAPRDGKGLPVSSPLAAHALSALLGQGLERSSAECPQSFSQFLPSSSTWSEWISAWDLERMTRTYMDKRRQGQARNKGSS